MLLRNFRPIGLITVVFVLLGRLLPIHLIDSRSYSLSPAIPDLTWISIGALIFAAVLAYAVIAVLIYGSYQGRQLSGPVRWSKIFFLLWWFKQILSNRSVLGTAIVYAIAVGLASTLFIIPGLYVAAVYWPAIPTAAAEDIGVFAALSRGAELTRGYRSRIFMMFLVLVGIVIVAGEAATLIASLDTSSRIIDLLDILFWLFIVALWAVAGSVTYHDLRVAKEEYRGSQPSAVIR